MLTKNSKLKLNGSINTKLAKQRVHPTLDIDYCFTELCDCGL